MASCAALLAGPLRAASTGQRYAEVCLMEDTSRQQLLSPLASVSNVTVQHLPIRDLG